MSIIPRPTQINKCVLFTLRAFKVSWRNKSYIWYSVNWILSKEVLKKKKVGLENRAPYGRAKMIQWWLELTLFPDTSLAILWDEKKYMAWKEGITLALSVNALLQIWLVVKAVKGWSRGKDYSEITGKAPSDYSFPYLAGFQRVPSNTM